MLEAFEIIAFALVMVGVPVFLLRRVEAERRRRKLIQGDPLPVVTGNSAELMHNSDSHSGHHHFGGDFPGMTDGGGGGGGDGGGGGHGHGGH